MNALIGGGLPSTMASTVRLLWRSRLGLTNPGDMPHIERRIIGVRVNESWLQRYLVCCGAGRWPATRLPPLALQIAAAPLQMAVMEDRAFPIRPLGIVHQSQLIQQWFVLNTSASYDLHVFTGEAREERLGISFGLVTEARQSGNLVWRSEVRILSLNRARERYGCTKQSRAGQSELASSPGERIFVPESTGRDYARIANDYNPVHLHAWLARLFGFRHAIAHGTWTLARALFLTELPESPRFKLEARFLRPVELPGTIMVRKGPGVGNDDHYVHVASSEDEHPLISASISCNAA